MTYALLTVVPYVPMIMIFVVLVAGGGILSLVYIFTKVLNAMQDAAGIAPPTSTQLEHEDFDKSALYRHFPTLKYKIAFRCLGDTFPTPIHRGSISSPDSGNQITFAVKREDLASSNVYGGNKVRTLQHQLAACEAKSQTANLKEVMVVLL